MALSVGKALKMTSESHQGHRSYQIPSRQNEVMIQNPGNLLTSSLKDPASEIFNDTYTVLTEPPRQQVCRPKASERS